MKWTNEPITDPSTSPVAPISRPVASATAMRWPSGGSGRVAADACGDGQTGRWRLRHQFECHDVKDNGGLTVQRSHETA
jgi:hypothetical protein